jgi:hypothetical protein
MADGLAEALAGLQASPAQNPYGIASMGLASAAPNLITPYTSSGAAVGIGLGSVLLQSLLGYQARQSALQDTIQANSLANQMLKMQTPEERTSFIGGLDVSPDIGGRLSTLSLALAQQEQARRATQAEKLAELTTAADFELGPKGTELFNRKTQAELGRALATAAANRKPVVEKDWFEKIPAAQKSAFTGTTGQVEQLRNLANTFRELGSNAVELNIEKQIPGSKADLALSAMQTLVPSTVKMLGDTGALSAYDQEAVRKATLGSRLSGSVSIADRLDQLADLAQSKTITSLEAYKTASESGGAGLMEQLKAGQGATGDQTAKQKRMEELRRGIAEMKTLLAQRQK